MYYIKGKVIEIYKNYIILESLDNVGYKIYFSSPSLLKKGEKVLVYTFQELKLEYKNQITSNLFGFISHQEYELFNIFLTINGVGCKTAQAMLTNNLETILDLAERGERIFLAELRGFNLRIANCFINTFQKTKNLKQSLISLKQLEEKKVNNSKAYLNSWNEHEIILALTAIGYKWEEIRESLNAVKNNKSKFQDTNSIINECLKIISQTKQINVNCI